MHTHAHARNDVIAYVEYLVTDAQTDGHYLYNQR